MGGDFKKYLTDISKNILKEPSPRFYVTFHLRITDLTGLGSLLEGVT